MNETTKYYGWDCYLQLETCHASSMCNSTEWDMILLLSFAFTVKYNYRINYSGIKWFTGKRFSQVHGESRFCLLNPKSLLSIPTAGRCCM